MRRIAGFVAEQVDHPLLRDLYRYWDGLRCGRELPSRNDLGPADIRDMLGSVALVDVLYDPLRFRFRLVGTKIARRWGFDMTGRIVGAFPVPDYRDLLIGIYRSIVEMRQPQVAAGRIELAGRMRDYEELWLPLSGNSAAIDMLLGGFFACDLHHSPAHYVGQPAWL